MINKILLFGPEIWWVSRCLSVCALRSFCSLLSPVCLMMNLVEIDNLEIDNLFGSQSKLDIFGLVYKMIHDRLIKAIKKILSDL